VSIKIDTIAASVELRARAAQTLGLFLAGLLAALLLVIPGQTEAAFGVERVVLAVVAGVVLLRLDRQAKSGSGADASMVARVLDVASPTCSPACCSAAQAWRWSCSGNGGCTCWWARSSRC
jgi:hypothetical protein